GGVGGGSVWLVWERGTPVCGGGVERCGEVVTAAGVMGWLVGGGGGVGRGGRVTAGGRVW
ncbi:hypothetical protein, partial [Achromobacter ruhlandii]|uniref:hypothetical protein n=1 Tax=Achromobacter ruhlandii TaxID=72557 RepID=UPI001B8AC8D4